MLRAMRTTVAALSIAACAVAAPRVARANGGNSHTWISMHAIEHLPEGSLKELLIRGTEVGNLVKLRPQQDWAEDEVFTVTVAPGLVTNDGLSLDQPWSFTFSTAPAAEPVAPTGDPTPHAGEPDVGSLPDAGCCGVGGGGGRSGASAGVLGLLVLGLLRRQRRGQAPGSQWPGFSALFRLADRNFRANSPPQRGGKGE